MSKKKKASAILEQYAPLEERDGEDAEDSELLPKLATANAVARFVRPGFAAAQKCPELPKGFDAFYDPTNGSYWCKNLKGNWQKFNSDRMTAYLKTMGYYGIRAQGVPASEIDLILHHTCFEKSVDWVGELGGWRQGVHKWGENDILILKGNTPVEPVKGKCPLIVKFFKTLLGPVQMPYFLGWLKGSIAALKGGYPFRPGQLVAFAGGVNSGKSFAQTLVTMALGGRQGDPTSYLLDKNDFTASFFKAEHLFIEDKALKDFTVAKRRAFAANLKTLVVNQEQSVHPKGKEPFLLPVGTRITLSCNDTPAALAILPALDNDVKDKTIYFMCGQGDLPARHDPNMDWGTQLKMFRDEMPAFVYWLEQYKIPPEILDKRNRFTVSEYHNEDICDRLKELSAEKRMLDMLGALKLQWNPEGMFTGTATAVECWINEAEGGARMLEKITYFQSNIGQILTAIAKEEGEERIKITDRRGRENIYTVYKDHL